MKKKYLALLLCLIMCASVVTGCNLFTRNDENYFEAVVCTIDYADGQKDEIRKRELLLAYNSYGYNYEQNYGQERKEAVKSTLDTIINQHITVKAVEDYYKNSNQKLFENSETTYLWDQTYSSIFSNLQSYYNEVIGKNSDEESSSTEDSTSEYKYTPYEKKVYLQEDTITGQNGNDKKVYTLKKYQTASTTRDTYKPRTLASGEYLDLEDVDSQEFFYSNILSLFSGADKDAKAWKSAFNKYISSIKENYTYKKFGSDKECFLFEVNRVYEILKDNYIVEKYSDIYNTANHQDKNTANVTIDNILKHYSSKVRIDYETYKNDHAAFDTQILTDVANMDYIYEGMDESHFFYYGFIKMAFSDEQKAKYDNIQNSMAGNLAPTKEAELQKVYDSVQATIHDEETGDEVGKINSSTLLATMKQEMAAIPNTNADYEKLRAEKLRKYLYLYNDDSSLRNAEFNAVAGVSSTGEVLVGSTFSSNDDAKEALKALYNSGNAQIGDLSSLVKGSDGYYIFFYAGKPVNLFGVTENFDISNKPENIKVLSSTKLNIFSNKTLLDKIYDELTTDNFSVFQNLDINNMRSNMVVENGIVIIENNIKDLY